MNNKMWLFVAIIAAAFIAFRLMAKPDAGEKAAAREKIKQGALVVDVRTPDEYDAGHYANATNIPVSEISKRAGELGDKNRAIVVYCAAGMRAAQAKSALVKAGFKDVTNAGGLSDLQPAKN